MRSLGQFGLLLFLLGLGWAATSSVAQSNGGATFSGKVTSQTGGFQFPDGSTQLTAFVPESQLKPPELVRGTSGAFSVAFDGGVIIEIPENVVLTDLVHRLDGAGGGVCLLEVYQSSITSPLEFELIYEIFGSDNANRLDSISLNSGWRGPFTIRVENDGDTGTCDGYFTWSGYLVLE